MIGRFLSGGSNHGSSSPQLSSPRPEPSAATPLTPQHPVSARSFGQLRLLGMPLILSFLCIFGASR